MAKIDDLEDLIDLLVREGGSDLHLKVGSPPVMRVNGLLAPAEDYGVLDLPDTEALLEEIIPENLTEDFGRFGPADRAYPRRVRELCQPAVDAGHGVVVFVAPRMFRAARHSCSTMSARKNRMCSPSRISNSATPKPSSVCTVTASAA